MGYAFYGLINPAKTTEIGNWQIKIDSQQLDMKIIIRKKTLDNTNSTSSSGVPIIGNID
jgi:hypothetical protein